MDFKSFKTKFQNKEVVEYSNTVNEKPLATVLVQTYNQKGYIRTCLDGLLQQQTTFDFEIIIGDDESTDGTREICLEYAQQYPSSIRLILHDRENQIKIFNEPSANFNALYNLFISRGKFIAFCEGDDVWTDKSKLEKQVKFLQEQPSYSFTYHDFKTINFKDIKTSSMEEDLQPKFDISRQDLIKVKYHPLLLTMCFRNLPANIPSQFAEVLNIDSFILSYLGNLGMGKHIKDIDPSYYRKHPGGIWSERLQEKKFLSKILTYSKLEEYYKDEKELQHYFKLRIKQVNRSLWIFYINQGEIYKALQLTGKIF